MNILFRIKQPLDWVLKSALVLFFFSLFACVIIQVFTRYVMDDPAVFTEEVSRYSMIWLSLLGSAYACGRLEHMAYTMFPDKLSGAKLHMHMRSIAIIVLLFGGSVMIYGGSKLVLRALEYGQVSATMQWPMGYVYLCIPLSGALIVFYQILILLKPSHFERVDEVKAALEHVAEEQRKESASSATDSSSAAGEK